MSAYLVSVDTVPDADDCQEEKLVVFYASWEVFRLEKLVVLEAEAEISDEFVDSSVFHYFYFVLVYQIIINYN